MMHPIPSRDAILNHLMRGLRADYDESSRWVAHDDGLPEYEYEESLRAQHKAARRYRLALWAIGITPEYIRQYGIELCEGRTAISECTEWGR